MISSIRSGMIWLDTEGKPIQAHGGSILYLDKKYYWYGENKEKTTGKNEIWHWGVRCYVSEDLYNWRDLGLIIEPDEENIASPLHPSTCLDRPHIIYNKKTKKYVCWMKVCGLNESDQYFAIFTADEFLGPYELVVPRFKPEGRGVGDFDLVFDEITENAAVFVESNRRITSYDLAEDYLDVKGQGHIHGETLEPPYCREAPACFTHQGKHYIVTSGMTGYVPNPSEIAVADNLHGPYRIQGNPHKDDTTFSSYNSQISNVFKHPVKKDLYIALADRWVPEFPVTQEIYEEVTSLIAKMFVEQKSLTEIEAMRMKEIPFIKTANTSIARYVWLPIRFEGEMAYIDWKDEWRIEEY